MTFKVNNKIFAKAIAKLSSAIGGRKINNEIIENSIKINVQNRSFANGEIKPYGAATIFDGSKQIVVPFPLDSLEGDAASIFVSGSDMLSLAKAYDIFDESLIEFLADTKLTSKCGSSILILNLAQETPLLDKPSDEMVAEFIMEGEDLRKAVDIGGYCYSDNQVFSNICMAVSDEELIILSTDGYRAASSIAKIKSNTKLDKELILLIDGRCLFAVSKLFPSKINVKVYKNMIAICNADTAVILLLNEGNYPKDNLQKLLNYENEKKTKIKINMDELKVALNIITIMNDGTIHLLTKKKELILTTKDKKGEHIIEIDTECKEINIGLDFRRFKDMVSRVQSKVCELIIYSEKEPIQLSDNNNIDKAVLLPLNH